MNPENWKRNLEEIPVKGYHILDARELIRRDLNIHRKTAPVVSGLGLRKRDRSELTPFEQFLLDRRYFFNPNNPVCYFVVFERDEELDDSHGVDRFAVAFICQEAILFYALFFFWPWMPAPTWVVIQSDMETRGLFGRGEPLEQAAITIRKLPKYLLVGYNTEAWQNYTEVDNVWPRPPIMSRPKTRRRSVPHGKSWFLYRRDNSLSDEQSGESEGFHEYGPFAPISDVTIVKSEADDYLERQKFFDKNIRWTQFEKQSGYSSFSR